MDYANACDVVSVPHSAHHPCIPKCVCVGGGTGLGDQEDRGTPGRESEAVIGWLLVLALGSGSPYFFSFALGSVEGHWDTWRRIREA